jgi:hypothetical protein
MSRDSFRPAIEDLGDRIVPTSDFYGAVAIPISLLPGQQTVSLTPPPVHALVGTGAGAYAVHRLMPDVGSSYELSGAGNVTKLGMVTVDAKLHSVGFIANGHAGGTMTFTNPRGSLTIELTGPSQPGFSALPSHFSYQVLSGTGSFQNVHGTGTIDVRLTPGPSGAAGAFQFYLH